MRDSRGLGWVPAPGATKTLTQQLMLTLPTLISQRTDSLGFWKHLRVAWDSTWEGERDAGMTPPPDSECVFPLGFLKSQGGPPMTPLSP